MHETPTTQRPLTKFAREPQIHVLRRTNEVYSARETLAIEGWLQLYEETLNIHHLHRQPHYAQWICAHRYLAVTSVDATKTNNNLSYFATEPTQHQGQTQMWQSSTRMWQSSTRKNMKYEQAMYLHYAKAILKRHGIMYKAGNSWQYEPKSGLILMHSDYTDVYAIEAHTERTDEDCTTYRPTTVPRSMP